MVAEKLVTALLAIMGKVENVPSELCELTEGMPCHSVEGVSCFLFDV